jgi:uncharacterized membrane protein
MTKRNRTKGVVSPFVLFLLVIVLSVLLSYFFWSLYCLSFCPISFGHCIVQRTINDHSKKFGSSVALRAIIDEMLEDTKGVIKVINQ